MAAAPWQVQEAILWRGLARCQEEGLAVCIGVSNYGAKELRKIHKKLESRGIKLASVQVCKAPLRTENGKSLVLYVGCRIWPFVLAGYAVYRFVYQ